MKRLFSLTIITVLVLSILSACSSNENESASGNESSDKTIVEFWALDNHKSIYEPIIEEFEKEHADIDINMSTRTVDAHKEGLKVASSSDTLPHIWFNWGGSLGSFYPENGLTLDLTEHAEAGKWNELYLEKAIELTKYEDQITGVPTKLAALGIFYRKDIFDELGIKVPKTFEEFEAVMAKLKENNITPVSVGGKFGWHTMRFTEIVLEHYAGPELKDKLINLEESWDNPAVEKTYAKLKEWEDKGYFPTGFITSDPNEAKMPFYSGDAAMILEGPWFDTTATEDEFDLEKIGVFTFPTEQEPLRTSSFVEMLQIKGDAKKEQQDAAIEFALYATSKEVIEKHKDIVQFPVAAAGVEVPENLPNAPKLVEAFNNGAFVITDQALPQEMVVKFFEAQDNVITGEFSPKDAAEFLQKSAEELK
ncbi:ABC transporter substrate-binding protein [Metabacillus bambusae]|uniref:Carbohydrate ABC transporter substrate-binding protein n=1 Tax=Metabacillus bambusae TaxID=2795218 RepID=A0ABS3MXH7_9BACI|nr:ABC transporter substrate-binding protein [Metabacillus bambusae]MBO1510704.1 carbohydrate ABC transporter substrate-binding protein [Metabacillus bambusae]